MTNNNCLNCGKALTDKYCSGCGQKADTGRITFKKFLFHDVIHGTFHMDKGILFTAKQALIRPGKAALEYIAGKRKQYYNVFYLILITIGMMLFVRHIDQYFTNDTVDAVAERVYINEESKKLDELVTQKSKYILLLFIPFTALNSFVLFRRSKLFLSENFILSGMVLLGILLLSTFANLYFPINNFLNLSGTIASLVITAIIISYVFFAYYNAFSHLYTRWGITFRIVLFYLLLFLEIFILFLLAYGYVTDWKYGKIHFAPFG